MVIYGTFIYTNVNCRNCYDIMHLTQIIVSEENGMISAAYEGELRRGLNQEELEALLVKIQKRLFRL